MECTQKLECTQDLYETHTQRICPEEIGFLGICGTKYPVKKGPNKIGRDPQTCGIVLNLNSVSRQHAVINVLSNNNFMIMDLDSANKTRLGVKTLQPYIPHPLKDGDTVQFGDVFGIFRLLEQDDELPMTQAIDIPDTPVNNYYISRINKVPITMVPESPDVSDRDDSFVAPSQKGDKIGSNHHYVNPSSKTISIQPIGGKKIDNVYWNSSKKSKSLSLSLNNSNASLDNSDPTVINRPSSGANDIHDMETQDPTLDKVENVGSIHAVETQMPEDIPGPSIHSQDTQVVPTTNAHMRGVQKVNTQCEMQINLYASNKENKDDLYEAETQLYHMGAPSVSGTPRKNSAKSTGYAGNNSNDKINSSHEEIIFDEINTQSFDEPLESQSLLPEDGIIPNVEVIPSTETNKNDVERKQEAKTKNKRVSRVKSSDSTDCEDMETALTQIISEKPNISDEDVTDCEDVENTLTDKITDKNEDNVDDIEYLQTQIIEIDEPNKDGECLEDMATQILVADTKPGSSIVVKNPEEEINFEDLPTQILVEDTIEVNSTIVKNPERDVNCKDLPTQIINKALPNEEYSQEIIGSFKIPLKAPLKNKRKDVHTVRNEVITIERDQYYQSTQDVFNDLCSEEQYSPEVFKKNMLKRKSDDNKRPLSSIIDCVIGSNIPHNEVPQNYTIKKSNNADDDIKLVSNSFKQKKIDLIVQKIKRTHSDSSDLDSTPKKGTALKFTDSDLPNSQEIKKSVNMNSKRDIDVFSSDSETENNSQDDDAIPLLYHKKKKPKVDAKLNLTKRFEADVLPSRVITRVRKPTERAESNKKSAAILKPNFLTEQEDGIDKEIITENISRLKTNNEKSKTHNKDTTKILYKSSIKKDKEPEKRDARAETSKTCKSNKELAENSTSEISEDKISKKKLQKSNSKVEPKSTSRRTRSKNKDNEPQQVKKHDSPDNVKREAEKTLSSKISHTFLESKEADRSKVSLDTTRGSNLSSRRPKRSRKEKVENRSVSPELELKEVKPKRTYKKRTKKTPDKEIEQPKSKEIEQPKSKEIDTELRRSRRIKTTKEVKETDPTPVKPKSILKPSVYDQSVVYNKSSESMTDSPNSLKRSAINELKVPSPKRTRSAIDPNSSLRPPKIHYVLFTTFPEEGVQAKLEKLGAVTVTDVSACTVLLTLGLRRTFKLLCAVGLGRPVVGRAWVQACVHTNTIVDPWLYILKDEVAEKRFHFDLERTLLGKRNYLKGFTVSSTPSVLPAAPEMKQIVECSGGVWGEGGSRWMVVSTPRDSNMWPTLRRRGASVVSSEFVLEGVLRQIPDVQPYLYK